MGLCCAGERDSQSAEFLAPEKRGRVTFNDLRGFRQVENIRDLYTFDEKLGAGQFGTVFRGTNLIANKECAIKVVDKKLAKKTDHHWKLMKDELDALQQL